MSWPAAIALVLWGAWVSVDERTWGSWAVQQPIVAGTVAGLILGDLRAGLAAGFVFQAVWPGLLPVGGSALPASGLAAVTAAAFCALGDGRPVAGLHWPGHPLLLPACVAGLAAAWAGELMEGRIRRRNTLREARALADWPGRPESLEGAFRAALLDGAIRGALITAVGLAVARASAASGLPARLAADRFIAATGGILPMAVLGICLGSAGRWLGAGRGNRPFVEISAGLVLGVLVRLLVLRP